MREIFWERRYQNTSTSSIIRGKKSYYEYPNTLLHDLKDDEEDMESVASILFLYSSFDDNNVDNNDIALF
jgi:hypothetical protein